MATGSACSYPNKPYANIYSLTDPRFYFPIHDSGSILYYSSVYNKWTGSNTTNFNWNDVTNTLTSTNLSLTGTFKDSSSDVGSSGQFLTSTATGTNWITLPSYPVVNNGTLAISAGTYITGSGTFTANQSTNTSITIGINATNLNTASYVVARDASGDFSAGIITAGLNGTAVNAQNVYILNNNATGDFAITMLYSTFTGNANYALKVASLSTLTYNTLSDTLKPVNILISGTFADASSSVGTSGQYLTSTATGTNWVTLPTIGNGTLTITPGTFLTGGTLTFTANQSGNSSLSLGINATNLNTASWIVARDASGNFSAGNITATNFSGPGTSLTGTGASFTAGTANTVLVTTTPSTSTFRLVFADTSTNSPLYNELNLTYNPSTNALILTSGTITCPTITGSTAVVGGTISGTTITASSSFSGPGTNLSGTGASFTAGTANTVLVTTTPSTSTFRLVFADTSTNSPLYNDTNLTFNASTNALIVTSGTFSCPTITATTAFSGPGTSLTGTGASFTAGTANAIKNTLQTTGTHYLTFLPLSTSTASQVVGTHFGIFYVPDQQQLNIGDTIGYVSPDAVPLALLNNSLAFDSFINIQIGANNNVNKSWFIGARDTLTASDTILSIAPYGATQTNHFFVDSFGKTSSLVVEARTEFSGPGTSLTGTGASFTAGSANLAKVQTTSSTTTFPIVFATAATAATLLCETGGFTYRPSTNAVVVATGGSITCPTITGTTALVGGTISGTTGRFTLRLSQGTEVGSIYAGISALNYDTPPTGFTNIQLGFDNTNYNSWFLGASYESGVQSDTIFSICPFTTTGFTQRNCWYVNGLGDTTQSGNLNLNGTHKIVTTNTLSTSGSTGIVLAETSAGTGLVRTNGCCLLGTATAITSSAGLITFQDIFSRYGLSGSGNYKIKIFFTAIASVTEQTYSINFCTAGGTAAPANWNNNVIIMNSTTGVPFSTTTFGIPAFGGSQANLPQVAIGITGVPKVMIELDFYSPLETTDKIVKGSNGYQRSGTSYGTSTINSRYTTSTAYPGFILTGSNTSSYTANFEVWSN